MQVVYDGFVKVKVVENGHEVIETSDVVAALVHVVDTNEIVMVKQPRPAMRSEKNPEGILLEVPAGRFDRDLDVYELIQEELKEEIGATVKKEQIQLLNKGKAIGVGPGLITEKIYLAYVPIKKEQLETEERVFGVHDEQIERVFVKVEKLNKMVCEDLKSVALINWFLASKR